MNRCLYHSSFAEFISADDDKILGKLWDEYHGVTLSTTKEALKSEITIMKDVVSSFEVKNGEIVFEYNIPRLGKRIDVVLLLNGIVFGLEFKVGKSSILEADVDQVLDYALDLKHFHKFSEDRLIVPILIATDYGNTSTEIQMSVYNDRIVNPLVTGVPGAGKTLVGLDVAVKQTYQGTNEPVTGEQAVYLSGNGPLVAVLTEALAQDNFKKCKAKGEKKKLTDSRREVSKSIQIIHRYRDNMLAKIKNPVENGILEIDPAKAVKMENAGFGEVDLMKRSVLGLTKA